MNAPATPWARAAVCGAAFFASQLLRGAEPSAFLDVIRARAATLPVLEASTEAGSPKFTVVRLNAVPIVTAGETFGAIRVICPPDKPLNLVWMFSDTSNIDEYGLDPSKGGR